MPSQEKVVILAIGDTGTGKSQNGNEFFQKKDAFEINNQDSSTFITSEQHNTINGVTRYYIFSKRMEIRYKCIFYFNQLSKSTF